MAIEFITKKTGGNDKNKPQHDVALRVNKTGLSATGEVRYSLTFRFSPDVVKKIAPNSMYLVYGFDASRCRIYFNEADSSIGFFLSPVTKDGKKKQIQPTCYDPDFFMKYKGDYNLLFDKEEGLYYIDLARKLKK